VRSEHKVANISYPHNIVLFKIAVSTQYPVINVLHLGTSDNIRESVKSTMHTRNTLLQVLISINESQ